MRRGTVTKLATAGALFSLLTTGCLSSGGGGGGSGGSGGSDQGDKKVQIFGAFPGEEADAFRKALKPFEKESGINVVYTPSNDFVTLLRSKVAGNNVPDIALFPQPGLLQDLASQGKLAALDDVLPLEEMKKTLVSGLLDSSTVDGKVYGAPMRMAVKSIVWYPTPQFDKAGYTPPKTQDEMFSLMDKMKSNGDTPWCIGMESGPATGWVATDWVEEYMLRTAGPEKYDQWVKHEIPFNDPSVKAAAEEFQKVFRPKGNVLGGASNIVSTPFGESANPMFEKKPACYMHRQGNFITGFFPKPVQAHLDKRVSVFPFPGKAEGDVPVLGGGDLAGLFNKDDPDAVAVMKFITSDKFGGPWAKIGGWLSPHKSFDVSQYPDETTRKVADIAYKASVFRFDASDQMPAQVGSGTFWKQMTSWISGQTDLDGALQSIEDSWPSS